MAEPKNDNPFLKNLEGGGDSLNKTAADTKLNTEKLLEMMEAHEAILLELTTREDTGCKAL